MILGGQPPGKVGRRRNQKRHSIECLFSLYAGFLFFWVFDGCLWRGVIPVFWFRETSEVETLCVSSWTAKCFAFHNPTLKTCHRHLFGRFGVAGSCIDVLWVFFVVICRFFIFWVFDGCLWRGVIPVSWFRETSENSLWHFLWKCHLLLWWWFV